MSGQSLERVLQNRNLKLPLPPKPVGSYRPLILSGGVVYLSGQISKDAEGKIMTGKMGKDLTLEEGKRAAELAVLQAVSLIRKQVGLKKVRQILKMTGFVQSADHFYAQSDVMNAASELLVEIFGESGRHTRTTIGAASLPLNAVVEVELTLKLR